MSSLLPQFNNKAGTETGYQVQVTLLKLTTQRCKGSRTVPTHRTWEMHYVAIGDHARHLL